MQQLDEETSSMSRRRQSVQIKRAIRAKFAALAASDLSLSWGRGTACGWLDVRVRKANYVTLVRNFLSEQFDWSGYDIGHHESEMTNDNYLNLSVTDWDGRSMDSATVPPVRKASTTGSRSGSDTACSGATTTPEHACPPAANATAKPKSASSPTRGGSSPPSVRPSTAETSPPTRSWIGGTHRPDDVVRQDHARTAATKSSGGTGTARSSCSTGSPTAGSSSATLWARAGCCSVGNC